MNAERKTMQQIPIFLNKIKYEIETFQIMSNLRSNFFDFLSLVDSTEHFKKHTGGLISFTQLCSAKEYQWSTG